MKKPYAAFALAMASLLASAPASAQEMRSFTMGSPLSPASGQRTIVLNADTKWVNVAQGEAIKFVAGASEFGWRFDGPGGRSFDLRQVAPAGSLSNPVQVYIAPAPGHLGR